MESKRRKRPVTEADRNVFIDTGMRSHHDVLEIMHDYTTIDFDSIEKGDVPMINDEERQRFEEFLERGGRPVYEEDDTRAVVVTRDEMGESSGEENASESEVESTRAPLAIDWNRYKSREEILNLNRTSFIGDSSYDKESEHFLSGKIGKTKRVRDWESLLTQRLRLKFHKKQAHPLGSVFIYETPECYVALLFNPGSEREKAELAFGPSIPSEESEITLFKFFYVRDNPGLT